jgi:DNA polymerase III subunit gamma/tau
LLGQKDLDLAPDPRSGFEMVLLRMLTFKPVAVLTSAKPPMSNVIANAPVLAGAPAAVPVRQNSIAEPLVTAPAPTAVKVADADWMGIIAAIKIGGMTRELAHNCVLESVDDKVCTLLLDAGHKQLRSAVTEEKLQKALQAYYGSPLKLVINTEKSANLATPAVQITKDRENKQQAAVDAINADENIQALKEQFDARVLPGTIEPV